jgi:di/tricarboxylate transporter
MGLSFASKLGGSTTLIGSSVNLIVAGMTADAITAGKLSGMKPIGMFDQSWVAVPAAAAGLLYLIYGAPHLLRGLRSDTITTEFKQKYLSEFEVVPISNLEGKSIQGAELISSQGRELRSVWRHGVKLAYSPDLILQSARHQHQLVEVVVSAKASAIGHRLSDLPLPDSPYEVMLVGVSRNGEAPTVEELHDLRVEPGDGAMFEVNERFFYESRRESDFLIVKTWEGNRVKRAARAIMATVITLTMVILAASGTMSMLNAALLAAFAMLLTGCLTFEQAWGSVQWKTLVVLGAALGLESAIAGSGLSTSIAEICVSVGGRSPRVALVVIFVATMVMTNLIGYAAAAGLMFPVAMSISEMLGVNFKPFVIMLMMAASCSFINPAGFQTNLMVQKDGGYAFKDFAKVGVPLTLIVGAVVLLLAPIVYGT